MRNNHVQLREFIETIIELRSARWDDLRKQDALYLNERFRALAQALELRSAAYPTVKDFTDLKTHVDVELASRSGSSNAVTTMFQVITVLGFLISVFLAYLTYMKLT